MNKLLNTAIFICTLITYPVFVLAETVLWENIVSRQGLYYKKFSDVPFTGKRLAFSDNGQLFSKSIIKNGHLSYMQAFYENGGLESESEYDESGEVKWFKQYSYSNGSVELEGICEGGYMGRCIRKTFWDNGKLKSISTTVNHFDIDGLNMYFYRNGNKHDESFYIMGKLGYWVAYSPDGNVYAKSAFDDKNTLFTGKKPILQYSGELLSYSDYVNGIYIEDEIK